MRFDLEARRAAGGPGRARRRLVALASSLALAAACSTGDAPASGVEADNPGLVELYRADQADREAPWDTTLAFALRQMQRDSARREQVRAIVAAGGARTADDWYHAAMVMQHGGDSVSNRLAWEWARRSASIDTTTVGRRWLVAAAWDRYQLKIGRPQWYGTQIVRDDMSEPWRLGEIDTTRVTDADRAHHGVPTLAAMRARVDSLNRSP